MHNPLLSNWTGHWTESSSFEQFAAFSVVNKMIAPYIRCVEF